MLPMMVSALSLVDSFELGLCLQHQAGGNLTASDGGNQLFQPRDLSNNWRPRQ